VLLHADWLIPDWPAPGNVRAVLTTRSGGISVAPYESMNLGDHVGDRPAHVQANRDRLRAALDARAVFMRQVHGADVMVLDPAVPDGETADACMTSSRRLACTVMVADCLPVLLCARDGSAVAAAHAGWRGLAGVAGTDNRGVLEAVYRSFSALPGVDTVQHATETIAWLGPCIGPTAFEVGAEVKAAFEAGPRGAESFFTPAGAGKYLADLAGLARLRLRALGVTQIHGNDGSHPWCTVRNPARFFSHRRDAGPDGNALRTTGRMAACVWLE
jgi:polyphenol oxidase